MASRTTKDDLNREQTSDPMEAAQVPNEKKHGPIKVKEMQHRYKRSNATGLVHVEDLTSLIGAKAIQ